MVKRNLFLFLMCFFIVKGYSQNQFDFLASYDAYNKDFFFPSTFGKVELTSQTKFSFDFVYKRTFSEKIQVPIGVSYSYRSFLYDFYPDNSSQSFIKLGRDAHYFEVYSGIGYEVFRKRKTKMFVEFNVGLGIPLQKVDLKDSSTRDNVDYYLPFTGVQVPFYYRYSRKRKTYFSIVVSPYFDLYYSPLYETTQSSSNIYYGGGIKIGVSIYNKERF